MSYIEFKFKEWENKKKFTTSEAAKSLDITRGHYYKIKYGLTIPSAKLAEKVSRILSIDPGFLLYPHESKKGRVK